VSQKPVTDYLRKQFGSQLVDDFLAAVKEAEKEAEADTQKRFSLISKYLK